MMNRDDDDDDDHHHYSIELQLTANGASQWFIDSTANIDVDEWGFLHGFHFKSFLSTQLIPTYLYTYVYAFE